MQKIIATNPEAQSADLTASNIEQLKALFPELITESASGASVNVDVLKALVGDKTATDADEKYGLNWHGKRRARQLALTPSTGTLLPKPDESVDWDTTQNLMIEGDNLEVLKLLQKSYAGKVKLIYIDPPYNTGKDFVYPDNFQDNIKNYLELTGQVEGGQKISSNTEASGRFHTDWVNMMYPRLKLARNLLREDGVIIVHIDENEHSNLDKLLSELFGEENNLGTIVWDKRNPKGDATGVAQQHELICVYCRNRETFKQAGEFTRPKENAARMIAKAAQLVRREGGVTKDARKEYREWVRQQDLTGGEAAYNQVDESGDVFQPVSMAWPNKKRAPDDYFVSLIHPVTGKPCPVPERGWRNPSATMQKLLKDGQILYGDDETTQPRRKYLLKDNLFESVPSLLYYGSSDDALLAEMGIPFDTPKPVYVAKRLIQSVTRQDDIILDFFAGSSSAAHAVMQLNTEEGSQRRFIMVQLPEPTPEDSDARKAGFNTIADISRQRIELAGRRIKRDAGLTEANLDTGFRVFKLDHSNIRAWNPDRDNLEQTLFDHQDHLVEGRTESDVLYELLLKLGLDLCVPIEQRTIAGKDVHAVGGGVLMACLSTAISRDDVESLAQGIVAWRKELSPAGDTTCVFRDSAFVDDVAKTNLASILEQAGIANVRSL